MVDIQEGMIIAVVPAFTYQSRGKVSFHSDFAEWHRAKIVSVNWEHHWFRVEIRIGKHVFYEAFKFVGIDWMVNIKCQK